MNRVMFAGLIGLALTANAAFGIVIIPAPIPERVASSDVIVVGKVTGFADKTVSAAPLSGGPDKVEYQIAIVRVSDAILGAKDAKEIQVGFVPRPPAGVGPRPFLGRNAPPQLTVDEEAILLLTKHPDASFYVAQHFYDAIDKSSATYDKELEQVKRCVKLLADPTAGLKSKEADDRLLTAAMLVTRYRTPKAWAQKTEAIGAEESKLILQALAEGDWTPKPGDAFVTTPDKAFAQLGLTDKDGWTQPADFKDYPEAAKKWLKDNADKYRIQRFVADGKKDDKKDK